MLQHGTYIVSKLNLALNKRIVGIQMCKLRPAILDKLQMQKLVTNKCVIQLCMFMAEKIISAVNHTHGAKRIPVCLRIREQRGFNRILKPRFEFIQKILVLRAKSPVAHGLTFFALIFWNGTMKKWETAINEF